MAISNLTNGRSGDRWILRPRPNPQTRLRLFCFPYAGGGAELFRGWSDALPGSVEVCSVQLPGRSTRLREQPFTRFEPLIEVLSEVLAPHLDKPFALFGHSMGAMIAFEFARKLRRKGGPSPLHLFVSGRSAPTIPYRGLPTYNLPDAEFIEELRRLNGTPREVIENAELMELMLPLLRADFELVQTYVYRPEPLLFCPIAAIGGLQDEEVSRADIQEWREQTSSFSLKLIAGDHFFVQTARAVLLEFLSRKLHDLIRDLE